MHVHMCSSRGRGGGVRGGCGATGTAGARGKPRRRRFVGKRPKAQLTLALSSRRKASPGACPIILNYNTYMYVFITCALSLGTIWNPSCMIHRLP